MAYDPRLRFFRYASTVQASPTALLASRYEVVARLGRGGMGEVWRCRDRLRHGEEVAIKLVRAGDHDAERRRLFYEEVMAAAHLDHEGIARVRDVLRDGDDVALVMDLVRGRAWRQVGPLPYTLAAKLLSQVLEALAYAHAHNLLHLDVKPANIIVDVASERAVLVDFGIARLWRVADDGTEVGLPRRLGTPAYMAPEQRLPVPGALGPWTDLYAFGLLTYELLSGVRPFADADLDGPRLPPRLDTGALGFDERLGELLLALLAPDLEDRPTHAADVVHALSGMSRRGTTRGFASRDEATAVTRAAAENEAATASVTPTPPPSSASRPASSRRGAASPGVGPVPLARLRRRRVSAPVMAAVAQPTARSLYGLREPPLQGRTAIRRAVWKLVLASRHGAGTRVALLTGGPGQGKSRIAREAMERAYQTGLSHTAWTAWAEGSAGREGLRGVVESAVGGPGLTGAALHAHLKRWTRRFPGADDTRFVTEAHLFLEPRGRPTDADLPLRVATEALVRQARARGVVVVLDDIQHGLQAARSLVGELRRLEAPVAVIATARSALDRFEADARLSVPVLDDVSVRKFVQSQIELEPEALDALVGAAAGNPMYASEMVRDLLAESPASGPTIVALAELWDRRFQRAAVAIDAIGPLAVLRPRVSTPLLAALESQCGEPLSDAVHMALRAGLLWRRRGHLHWTHDLIREHVCARLEPDRRRELHVLAAHVLASRRDREDVDAERAHHLWAADHRPEARATMLDAIRTSHRAGDQRERRRRAARLRLWSEDDPQAMSFLALAHAELAHGWAAGRREDAARDHLEAASRLTLEHDAEASAWRALREAQVRTALGEDVAARSALARASALARRDDHGDLWLQVLGMSAVDAQRRDDPKRARALFARVIREASVRHDAVTEAKARFYLANLAPTESLPMFERAIETAQRAGAIAVELSARQVYADALYRIGRRDEARDALDRVAAQAQHRRLRQLASMVAIQRACWGLEEGDVDRAANETRQAIAEGAQGGSNLERAMVAALDAAIAGARGDRKGVVDALARLAQHRGQVREPDLQRVLSWATDHAASSLQPLFAEGRHEPGRPASS
ncbi:MAG: protein kinase [Myxococcota bacterium]